MMTHLKNLKIFTSYDNKMLSKLILVSLTFVSLSKAIADDSLQQTQALLTNQKAIDELSKSDSKVRNAQQFSNQAVKNDPQLKEELNQITANTFAEIHKLTQGDPEKMSQLLEKALQNPQEFYKSLSQEQKDKIRDLAGKVDKKQPQPKP